MWPVPVRSWYGDVSVDTSGNRREQRGHLDIPSKPALHVDGLGL